MTLRPEARLERIAHALSIGQLEYHVLLCADPTNPRCAHREHSRKVWAYLKRRLKELGLAGTPPSWAGDSQQSPVELANTDRIGRVLRTKVDCLRICEQGPICVIYPEGIWYHSVDESLMERIIQQHLIGGQPVREFQFAVDPLRGGLMGRSV